MNVLLYVQKYWTWSFKITIPISLTVKHKSQARIAKLLNLVFCLFFLKKIDQKSAVTFPSHHSCWTCWTSLPCRSLPWMHGSHCCNSCCSLHPGYLQGEGRQTSIRQLDHASAYPWHLTSQPLPGHLAHSRIIKINKIKKPQVSTQSFCHHFFKKPTAKQFPRF